MTERSDTETLGTLAQTGHNHKIALQAMLIPDNNLTKLSLGSLQGGLLILGTLGISS
jgi:hypothetical protein